MNERTAKEQASVRLSYVPPVAHVDLIPTTSLLETLSIKGNVTDYDSSDEMVESEDND